MTPRARRLLRWVFIATFLLLAPAVILSTAGYRYNFARKQVERTGGMIVDTLPEGATVHLNDKALKARTPLREARLAPGRYRVRVEKDGFRPWTADVEVESRVTTFLNRVVLFPAAVPLLSVPLPDGLTSFSPDGRRLALLTTESDGPELRIIDLASGQVRVAYRAGGESAAAHALRWSRNGRRLLIVRGGTKPGAALWDAENPEALLDLASLTDAPVADAFWETRGDRLFAVSGAALHEIDLANGLARETGPAATQGFVVRDRLYGLLEGRRPDIVARDLKEKSFTTVAELPSIGYRRLEKDGPWPGWTSGGHLALLDPEKGSAAFEARGVGGAWSRDGWRFLYWNDLELRVYDRGDGSDRLLTRIGTPIRKGDWHPDWYVTLHATRSGLIALGEADRFAPVATPVASFNDLRDFKISPDGRTAWFYGTIGKRTGLWTLELR